MEGVFPDITVVLERDLSRPADNVSYTVRYVDRPPEQFRKDILSGIWSFTLRPGFEDERTRRAAKAVERSKSTEEAVLAASVEGAGPDFVLSQESNWIDCRTSWISISDARTGEVLYSDPQSRREKKRKRGGRAAKLPDAGPA